uniref:Homeobox domain-containing protein n=1 Tax=Timema tahoe TaxID=61484 RepID=A0A7R9NX62_9NEOP|nr:unnamed protein product [Timema tahoe]
MSHGEVLDRDVTGRVMDSSESGSHKGRESGRSGGSNKTSGDGKPTRVRTVLNEKQLHTLRTCYNANPRPDALMKEQLVEMTQLSPRVIRVWFQNKRCKDKKKAILMKQQMQQEKNYYFRPWKKVNMTPLAQWTGALPSKRAKVSDAIINPPLFYPSTINPPDSVELAGAVEWWTDCQFCSSSRVTTGIALVVGHMVLGATLTVDLPANYGDIGAWIPIGCTEGGISKMVYNSFSLPVSRSLTCSIRPPSPTHPPSTLKYTPLQEPPPSSATVSHPLLLLLFTLRGGCMLAKDGALAFWRGSFFFAKSSFCARCCSLQAVSKLEQKSEQNMFAIILKSIRGQASASQRFWEKTVSCQHWRLLSPGKRGSSVSKSTWSVGGMQGGTLDPNTATGIYIYTLGYKLGGRSLVHTQGNDGRKLGYGNMQGIPMVASSPVRHESPLGMNPIEVQSYQPPWKALSDFALHTDLDRLDPSAPPFQHLVSQHSRYIIPPHHYTPVTQPPFLPPQSLYPRHTIPYHSTSVTPPRLTTFVTPPCRSTLITPPCRSTLITPPRHSTPSLHPCHATHITVECIIYSENTLAI